MLTRTPNLYRVLFDFFSVDSSVSTSEPDDEQNIFWPIRHHNSYEIPISLPMDATLQFMGLPVTQFGKVWMNWALCLVKANIPLVLATHPEPHFTGEAMGQEQIFRFIDDLNDREINVGTLNDAIAVAKQPPLNV